MTMMIEVLVFGVPVVVIMVGVPICRSICDYKKGRIVQLRLLQWWFTCGLIVLFSMSCGLAFGIAGFVISNLPATSSPSKAFQVSTDCRILSSGIDLRTTKVCTPRLVPPYQGTVLMQSKFRCYFEYYWASVFKVEFKPYLSEMAVQAATEVPREALPAHCRPGFGSVWTLKERYQVNGTYPCKYNPGSLRAVEMEDNDFASCKSESVSVLKLIKQAFLMLLFSDQWILSTTTETGIFFWRALSCIFLAACYSIFVTGFAKTVWKLRFMLFGSQESSAIEKFYFEARLQITCILLTTLFGAAWYIGQVETLTAHIDRFL